jgi:RoxA-like, cytochrome c-like
MPSLPRRTGKLNGVNVNFAPFTPKIGPIADADSMVSNEVIGMILGQLLIPPPDELRLVNLRGGRARITSASAIVRQQARYKARPINGIWTTAPYLHNGSVPNLDALLRPAAQRPLSFSIGVKTFDPVRMGYTTDVAGFPRYSVQNPDGSPIVGNSNAGHEFGAKLSDDERSWLLEYLKTL